MGLNTDRDKEMFKKQCQNQGVTWTNAFTGGTDSAIPKLWDISSYPSTFLLDAEGRIVAKHWLKNDELDRAVDELLEKAKK